ncbi:MAG: hypothetical protein MJZ90_10310 [Bacteroidales bacterium]|nr:hypothetical protein [Bacteroidales bacterium]
MIINEVISKYSNNDTKWMADIRDINIFFQWAIELGKLCRPMSHKIMNGEEMMDEVVADFRKIQHADCIYSAYRAFLDMLGWHRTMQYSMNTVQEDDIPEDAQLIIDGQVANYVA